MGSPQQPFSSDLVDAVVDLVFDFGEESLAEDVLISVSEG